MTPPRTQRRPSAPPPVLTPTLVGGNFIVTINKPFGADLSGPMNHIGLFTIAKHLEMIIEFRGAVKLPAGAWEIGLIQNLFNHTHRRQYSSGGFAFFSMDPPPGGLLDSGQNVGDIWFDPPEGSRSVTFRMPTHFTFVVRGTDMPADLTTFAGLIERCNGKFGTEMLLWIYNSLRFRAILAVRQGGQSGTVLPLAMSDPYGCDYLFTIGDGAPTDDWLDFKPRIPKKTYVTDELSMQLSYLRVATSLSSTRANEYVKRFNPTRDLMTNCNEYVGPYTPERMGITGF